MTEASRRILFLDVRNTVLFVCAVGPGAGLDRLAGLQIIPKIAIGRPSSAATYITTKCQ